MKQAGGQIKIRLHDFESRNDPTRQSITGLQPIRYDHDMQFVSVNECLLKTHLQVYQ